MISTNDRFSGSELRGAVLAWRTSEDSRNVSCETSGSGRGEAEECRIANRSSEKQSVEPRGLTRMVVRPERLLLGTVRHSDLQQRVGARKASRAPGTHRAQGILVSPVTMTAGCLGGSRVAR